MNRKSNVKSGGHVVTSEMGHRTLKLSPGMHMGVDIDTGIGEKLQAFEDGDVDGDGDGGGGDDDDDAS